MLRSIFKMRDVNMDTELVSIMSTGIKGYRLSTQKQTVCFQGINLRSD
jgi:hypothetical protein